jgi:hypothetical protein
MLAARLMMDTTPMMSPALAPSRRSAITSSTLPFTAASSPTGNT